jgi:2-keto-4-pentenoate hydratase/2-oxohepta-3-ene-1,7-dioic acid hydratase in catechol pathway
MTKLLSFLQNNQARLGQKTEAGIVPLRGTLLDLMNGGSLQPDGDAIPEGTLTFLPPLYPGKIICIGLNYRKHAAETNQQPPDYPMLFSKFGNTPAAHGEEIPIPSSATQIDYEAELAVVIGRQVRNVSEVEALDTVFGYCSANDVSARDLQRRTSQYLLGKTLDKFFPFGPYIVTKDEIPDPQALSIQTFVNGEQRQNSTTGDMIFSVAQLISYISNHFTLEPGDIISTGTPEGVIAGMAEKVWLKPGDEVTVSVEGLGSLTNRFAAGK